MRLANQDWNLSLMEGIKCNYLQYQSENSFINYVSKSLSFISFKRDLLVYNRNSIDRVSFQNNIAIIVIYCVVERFIISIEINILI